MDLVVIVVLIVLVLILKRDYKSFVYILGVSELFLRLCHFIGDNLGIVKLNEVVDKYLPVNLFALLNKYADGLLYTILSWLLIVCFISLLVYLVKYLIKKN